MLPPSCCMLVLFGQACPGVTWASQTLTAAHKAAALSVILYPEADVRGRSEMPSHDVTVGTSYIWREARGCFWHVCGARAIYVDTHIDSSPDNYHSVYILINTYRPT